MYFNERNKGILSVRPSVRSSVLPSVCLSVLFSTTTTTYTTQAHVVRNGWTVLLVIHFIKQISKLIMITVSLALE